MNQGMCGPAGSSSYSVAGCPLWCTVSPTAVSHPGRWAWVARLSRRAPPPAQAQASTQGAQTRTVVRATVASSATGGCGPAVVPAAKDEVFGGEGKQAETGDGQHGRDHHRNPYPIRS